MKFQSTILLLFIFLLKINAQTITWQELAPLPEKVTNNAVTAATVAGIPYVYSFAGIDSTKACGRPHLRAFRYNTAANEWESIEPLPDPLGGKIAAAASTVKNKIYIIGGYHVANNCGETSSTKIHIFDPETNAYLPDGADLPKAIDDHVQAVWRDSLIYVITGWSNTANVTNVQIYNPLTNEWTAGTPVPNSSDWKVFGASGTIVGDTIYFAGGAGNWNGSTFPPTSTFRKGIIDPADPTQIVWEADANPSARGYRMAVTSFQGKALWFGGSTVTYNFDGIAYNGSGGVAALDRALVFDPQIDFLNPISGLIPKIMDLRGIAKISDKEFILAGGMKENQQVTNRVVKITIDDLTATKEPEFQEVNIFPNPADSFFIIQKEGFFKLEIFDASGKIILKNEVAGNKRIDISSLPTGSYNLRILNKNQVIGFQKLVKS